jgi:hypothetical protein
VRYSQTLAITVSTNQDCVLRGETDIETKRGRGRFGVETGHDSCHAVVLAELFEFADQKLKQVRLYLCRRSDEQRPRSHDRGFLQPDMSGRSRAISRAIAAARSAGLVA